MADYLGLLRELAAFRPPLHVFGSIAEAALLDGALSSSHGDLDVLAPRADLELWLRRFDGLGFGPFAVLYEPRPGLPLVYGVARDELAVELSLLDRDSAGDPYFAVRAEAGVVAVSLPRDLLEWPPATVAGVPVHTLSPLALIQMRAGAIATARSGPPGPTRTSRDRPG